MSDTTRAITTDENNIKRDKGNICLIVIFNHRYDKNLSSIARLYKDRFKNIYVLMPFYNGESVDGLNIIPVYESSFFYSGYLAQGLKYIKNKYSHYVVIGDDVVLNPNINEENILEFLSLRQGQSYIKGVCPICEAKGIYACRLNKYIMSPFLEYSGTEYKNMILSREEAFERVRGKGYKYDLTFTTKWLTERIQEERRGVRAAVKDIFYIVSMLRKNRGKSFPYPFYKDFVDFLVLSGDDIEKLIDYFGVFAAMGLFVEVAVPTAMALMCSDIVTESMIDKRGVELWGYKDRERFNKEYNYELGTLFEEFPSDVIYYHPVKLSKWRF